MILAPLARTFLRESVAHATLPEEDLLVGETDVLEALRFGFPRLMVYAQEEESPLVHSARMLRPGLPRIVLSDTMTREWEREWRQSGARIAPALDAGRRLRGLMNLSASPPRWVDDVFRQLSSATAGPLPPAFRGMARRVLEFPRRYDDLHGLANLTGCSRDALKARFRRRGLPSPSRYVRWLRVVAVAYALSEEGATTASVAYQLGYSSGGNLCRSVQGLVGHTTIQLREPIARSRLLLRLAGELLDGAHLGAWRELDELFVRRAA